MNAPARLTAFAAVLALLFAAGTLAGGVFGPDRGSAAAAAGHHDSPSEEHTDMTSASATAGGPRAVAGDHPVRGLAVADNGLRVVVAHPELQRGRDEQLAFRIVDEHGSTIRHFDVEHTKRMHLILARRDLTGFQHLHPEQRGDGTWTAPVRLDAAGSYRLFADFSREGTAHTLATDLRVDGRANLRPLPAPSATAVSDGGYGVRLDAGRARPGEQPTLRFTITRDGVPVHTEPYLGAGGHLVALREGDLAFLHVHPTGDAADDGSIGFAATFPTEGGYRLFLQFRHEGRVHTVAFTQQVS